MGLNTFEYSEKFDCIKMYIDGDYFSFTFEIKKVV